MGLLQSIAGVFFPFAKRRWSSSSSRQELGAEGERLAARALRRTGYKVLYRNFRPPGGGEVDLVCRHGEVLVFVEVKARRTDTFGAPAEAVTRAKQELISRGAVAWLRLLHHPPIHIRFDIAEVRFVPGGGEEVRVIENAFPLPERYRL